MPRARGHWAAPGGGGRHAQREPQQVGPGPAVRRGRRRRRALKDLLNRRTLVYLSLGNTPLANLEEPRIVPLELLAQLTPLARSIREKSRMSGELILKRDIGDGRREELFVPRATLTAQFARLPHEYRRPFEDMGITNEETAPAIHIARPPAPPRPGSAASTMKIGDD